MAMEAMVLGKRYRLTPMEDSIDCSSLDGEIIDQAEGAVAGVQAGNANYVVALAFTTLPCAQACQTHLTDLGYVGVDIVANK